MARIGVVWSAAARRVADAAVAMGMFALVAAFVVSGAREARAQSVVGWGETGFSNIDDVNHFMERGEGHWLLSDEADRIREEYERGGVA